METPEQQPFILAGYKTRFLQDDDVPSLQIFLQNCTDYYELVTGLPPGPCSAYELLKSLPEGKTLADKFVIGIFRNPKAMIGVLDTIQDYPRQSAWWLGLLLLDPKERGKGLGKQIYFAYEQWVARSGAEAVFLGVVARNERACHFWKNLGFRTVETRPPRKNGGLEQAVLVMRRVVRR